MTLPADPAQLRKLLGLRFSARGPNLKPKDVVRLLLRTDAQLLAISAAVVDGVQKGLSCYLIAAGLPKYADENLVRAFIRAAHIPHESNSGKGWARWHQRQRAAGTPYNCRRGPTLNRIRSM